MGASLGVFHGADGGNPWDPLGLGGEWHGEEAAGKRAEERPPRESAVNISTLRRRSPPRGPRPRDIIPLLRRRPPHEPDATATFLRLREIQLGAAAWGLAEVEFIRTRNGRNLGARPSIAVGQLSVERDGPNQQVTVDRLSPCACTLARWGRHSIRMR
jgi:hypothetical protein